MILWSHFEVLWVKPSTIQSRYFDSRLGAEEYAAQLAGKEFTKCVELRFYESPHGGGVEVVKVKGDYAAAVS